MMSNCSPCSCSCTPCCCQPFYGGPSTTTTTIDPNIPTTTTTTVCEEIIPIDCIIYNGTFLTEYGVNPGDSLADILNLISQFLCACTSTTTTTSTTTSSTTTTTTIGGDCPTCHQIRVTGQVEDDLAYTSCEDEFFNLTLIKELTFCADPTSITAGNNLTVEDLGCCPAYGTLSIEVINSNAGMIIDVYPTDNNIATYCFSNITYPINQGSSPFTGDVITSFNGDLDVQYDISSAPNTLSLYVNGSLIECYDIPDSSGTHTYTFTNVTWNFGDDVSIRLTDGVSC